MKKKIERRLAKKVAATAGKRPVALEWQPPKVKNRHGHIFAKSQAYREFTVEQKGFFSKARKLIQEKIRFIEKGKIVVNKECTVAVQRASTGKFRGKRNFLTMKVSVEGREFFVKIASPHWVKANINGLLLANEFLRKKSYRIGKFNVRAILPQKAVTYKGVTFLATDFVGSGEVEMVSEMEKPGEVLNCIKGLEKELSRIGVSDVLPENAFYHKKTNTILLFDLNAK